MVIKDEAMKRFKELEKGMMEVFTKATQARQSEIDRLREEKAEIDKKISQMMHDIMGEVLKWLESQRED